ncbi:MAG: NifB/NifX family molybdenum-iron cluster-binding protein [Candidatus Aminicenantes bacterium]|jgi:predicted Fe-Mo cluster-binding NifX family protein
MKVLIAIEDNAGLDSILDRRFGRAGYFLVYDTDEKKILAIQENQFKNDGHGVGIKTATFVIENGCQAIIGAQPGPKAASILAQANVKMIVEDKGTVKEVLEKHKQDLTV